MGSDEEDVAISVFAHFCHAHRADGYPELRDRSQLWALLKVLTVRKVRDYLTRENAAKRGGRDSRQVDVLDSLQDPDTAPFMKALMADEVDRLLDALQLDNLKTVALAKLHGFTNEEIAADMGCTRQTIQRRLVLIRKIWNAEITRLVSAG